MRPLASKSPERLAELYLPPDPGDHSLGPLCFLCFRFCVRFSQVYAFSLDDGVHSQSVSLSMACEILQAIKLWTMVKVDNWESLRKAFVI